MANESTRGALHCVVCRNAREKPITRVTTLAAATHTWWPQKQWPTFIYVTPLVISHIILSLDA
jgi:hypothetical protein